MTVVVGAVCMQVQILPATALAVDNRVLMAQDWRLSVQAPAELLDVVDGPLETDGAADVTNGTFVVVEDATVNGGPNGLPEPKVRFF